MSMTFLPHFVLFFFFQTYRTTIKLMTLTMHNCMNMYVADTVDGEVAGEGYGLYEDEEQDNYLEDEGELKDETLEDEFFDTENEE